MLTKLGSISIFRTGFEMHGGGIYYPVDDLMRIAEVKFTNGLKGMIAYLGALHPLRTAEELLMMFMEISASHNYCSKLVYEVGCDAETIETRSVSFVFIPLIYIIVLLLTLLVVFLARRYLKNNFELRRKKQ